jgi:hypothetical protein
MWPTRRAPLLRCWDARPGCAGERPGMRGKRDSAVRWDVPPGRRARHCLGIRAKGGRRQRRRDARRSGEGGLRRSARSPALLHRHGGPVAVGRPAAVLGLVELAPWLSVARALAIPRTQESISSASSTSCAIGSRDQPGVSRCFRLDEAGRSSTRCRLPPRLLDTLPGGDWFVPSTDQPTGVWGSEVDSSRR